jgi:uncharacterized protein
VRLNLRPSKTSFYEMFATSGQNLVVGARLLKELLGADPSQRKEIAEKMRAAEHAGDEATHAIMRELNETFVTPFDREDIYRLASGLDDVLDDVEAVADMIVLYRIGDLPTGVADMVDVLDRAAELTADAMPRLRTMGDLHDYWIEVNRLENQADQDYRKLVAKIFSGEYDALTAYKLKDVVDTLESAVDGLETVANVVEQIALKES